MKKYQSTLNLEPEEKTITFWKLLKLKIDNQNDILSITFTYISMFFSFFNIVLLNINYVNIGTQSRILANQTGNFWVTYLLLLPYLFVSGLSFLFCFLSRLRKREFVGMLSFFLSIFNFIVYMFFWIFIAAVF